MEIKFEEMAKIRAQSPALPPKLFVSINDYKIASACPIRWDGLSGTGKVRFCEKCSLQIYDFTEMELPEAEQWAVNDPMKDF